MACSCASCSSDDIMGVWLEVWLGMLAGTMFVAVGAC